jgi:acetyl-CoA C-acetyltransferase
VSTSERRRAVIDPRTPCLVGWAQHTWPKSRDLDAPEPLDMWEQVLRAAATAARTKADPLPALDGVQVVYSQSWQYDDPVGRLADRLRIAPHHRVYSGIGGTTPLVLLRNAAGAIARGEQDAAAIVSAEALDTVRKNRKRGERPRWSFRDPVKKPFPFEAPFVPAEVAHEVFQAWLTFAMFDNARRAHLGVGLDEHRASLAELWHRFSTVAAANPLSWFPTERSVEDLLAVTADNRMVGYPYSKHMVSVMDVDMAAALLVMSHAKADDLGVPADGRIYLRGFGYATDPQPVAAHRDLWRSPAMAAASGAALRRAGVGVDDVAHLDLYSCFASSVLFARDALGLGAADPRPLTVTGGLPYFGGAGSGYLTHSIATMAQTLRADPGSYGLVSGVGMHMTKHAFGVLSTVPGPLTPADDGPLQERLDAMGQPAIVDHYEGEATVAAYSVAHGHDGPQVGVVVVDLPTADGRAYARVTDAALLAEAESVELVGREVTVSTDGTSNTARW